MAISLTLVVVIIVIATALAFDFTNGFHDSANAMAPSVATGAFTPKTAVLVAAILNLVGALMSTEVAKTISNGLFDERLVSPEIVFAGLAGAILWNLVTWLFGMPSSSSHALFGGLIGAVLFTAGVSGVHFGAVLSKIVLPAVIAPLVAVTAAAIATWLAYRIARPNDRYSERVFRNGQRISASLVALAHGTSDGQKTMGVITLVLMTAGMQAANTGPQLWVIVSAGAAIALGTYSGGWRIMRTLGKKVTDIKTPQGFAADMSSTVAILASSHLGFALSTTHITTGSVVGSGIGRRTRVHWSVIRKMLLAWVVTLPGAGLVGGVSAAVINVGGFPGLLVMLAVLLAGAGFIVYRAKRSQVDARNVIAEDHESELSVPNPTVKAAA